MPRRPIADMIEDIGAPEAPSSREPGEPAPRARRRGAGRPPDQAGAGRPSARDLAAPAKQNIPREALKVDVPAELALLQRLRRRRLDTGMDIRDQVAIAVDEWLTSDGY